MDELVYNSLSHYFNVLQKTGYYSYADTYKLLVYVFYKNFIFNDYRGLLSSEDYFLIEKALECLYGSTCLIPYPDYATMGTLNLGNITELTQRVKALEETEIVMPFTPEDTDSDSDIEVYEED